MSILNTYIYLSVKDTHDYTCLSINGDRDYIYLSVKDTHDYTCLSINGDRDITITINTQTRIIMSILNA
jgi:hypothetical protein